MPNNQFTFPIKRSQVGLLKRLFAISDWDKVLTMLLSIDWKNLPFDSYTDKDLALRIVPTVRHHRKDAKIPHKITVVNWDEQPLGEMPDFNLARRLGVSSLTVQRHRELRFIPKFAKKHSQRKPTLDPEKLE